MSAAFQNFGWDADADMILRQLANKATHGEIGSIIGCSTKAIQRRKRKLGIATKRAKFRCPMRHNA